MKSKRWLSLLLIAAALMTLLSGCGKPAEQSAQSEREQVSIAFWSDQLTEQYGEYLKNCFPEVDFTFYVATNSTDFYRFKEEHGDLPDILTVRRFALRDVEQWRDALMDLSDTELANTLHQSYLRSYTYEDGTVNWLPTCAEVDSVLVNKKLLEDNGLALPSNYEEFTELCGALREKGIRPFVSNFSEDYTCMEILQGLSANILNSQEGRQWRQQYESGQTDQLSEEVWLPVFQRMADFIDYAGIGEEDLASDTASVFAGFAAGESAMIRGTSAEAVIYDVDDVAVMMPYFGQTENWYLTYPAFQVAATVQAEQTPEREELILSILEAMLGQDGQKHIATGQDMISYSKDVDLELSSLSENLVPYLENNQMYIRLASSDMFSVSKQVVQGMIQGEYPDARAAFDAFNAAMKARQDSASDVARIETGYSYDFDPDGGSPAASAVMNTVRECVGTQLLIGPAASVAGNIIPGDYTEAELRYLTMGEGTDILLCDMTGEQVYQYLDTVLAMRGKRGSVINDSTLYVSSGFEMELKRDGDGYTLEALTVDGAPLDRDAVYSAALVGNGDLMLREALESIEITEYTTSETAYKQLVVDYIMAGNQLAEPTDYLTLG